MFSRFKAASVAVILVAGVSTVVATDASIAGEIVESHSGSALSNPSVSFPSIAHASPLTEQEVVKTSSIEGNSNLHESDDDQADAPERKAANLAALVAVTPVAEDMDQQMRCLAGAVYYESKGESLTGQLAVARVVINRANSGRFPNSLCGVVLQRRQFSFVRGGAIPAIDTSTRDWREAAAIAQIAMDNGWKNPAEGALFFHARYVSPGWKLRRVAVVENHIFYR